MRLDKVMHTGLPPEGFTKFAVGDQPWNAKLQGLQFFAATDKYMHVGFPQFGAMEGRFIVEGSVGILGMDPKHVPGENIREKRKSIMRAPFETLDSMCKDNGFITSVDAGECVFIPTGFIIVMCSVSEKVFGVSWGLSSDGEDRLRSMAQLGDILASFPETRAPSTGYQPFYEWLQRALCSGASPVNSVYIYNIYIYIYTLFASQSNLSSRGGALKRTIAVSPSVGLWGCAGGEAAVQFTKP